MNNNTTTVGLQRPYEFSSTSIDHNKLSTVSMKPVILNPFMSIGGTFEFQSQLYSLQNKEQIAIDELALKHKDNYEEMGYSPVLTEFNKNLRYTGLVNRLPDRLKRVKVKVAENDSQTTTFGGKTTNRFSKTKAVKIDKNSNLNTLESLAKLKETIQTPVLQRSKSVGGMSFKERESEKSFKPSNSGSSDGSSPGSSPTPPGSDFGLDAFPSQRSSKTNRTPTKQESEAIEAEKKKNYKEDKKKGTGLFKKVII